jgi:hypothetical protein
MLRGPSLALRAWQASRSIATRLWYENPAALMVACLVLAGAASVLGPDAESGLRPGGYVPILIVAFLCWRVSRKGYISRGILIFLTAMGTLGAAQSAQSLQIRALAACALSLAGLMLLLSPAVYVRTHPGSDAASSSIRLRPRRWMVLSAPVAGAAIAGLTLAVTRRMFLPGRRCMIGPVEGLPPHCVSTGRGFPEAVAATIRGHHVVSQLAFVRDCVQWTVLIFAVSYLLWLALRRRPSATGRPADAGLVARPSQW